MGRPPLFNDPSEMEDVIASYFSQMKEEESPITISGLALYLGFESRQSFYDYEKNGDFSYIIKRARLRVESEYEKKLSGNSVTGSIFALKNMGWKDKSEQEISVPQGVSVSYNLQSGNAPLIDDGE